jgi:hypothetical protein
VSEVASAVPCGTQLLLYRLLSEPALDCVSLSISHAVQTESINKQRSYSKLLTVHKVTWAEASGGTDSGQGQGSERESDEVLVKTVTARLKMPFIIQAQKRRRGLKWE